MKTLSRVVAICVALLCTAAYADITLEYLGAFRVSGSIYGGDLCFNPDGNGGEGSLLISRNTTSGSGDIQEITIPAPIITTDVSSLSTATTLRSIEVNTTPTGLALRSTDGLLYYSYGVAGSPQVPFRYCNLDGTGESSVRYGPAWTAGGWGLCQIPNDWANTWAGGKNLLTVGNWYGATIYACNPWDSAVTWTPLVAYDSGHLMTDYDYNDQIVAICWVSVGGEANAVVGGRDSSASAANLWFYRAADLQAPTNAYTPQPYQTLSVQDRMFASSGGTIFGLAYDTQHCIMYGYQGSYQQATVVHAWRVVNAPPSAVTNLGAVPVDWFSVKLTWTAPSDDHGLDGAASSYDVRYSTVPIDETNWDSATQATGEPAPLAAGQPQSFTVTGLQADTQYYFAIRTLDAEGNVSDFSNVPSATTNLLDGIAPDAVDDLSTSAVKPNRVTFSWTATGDDGRQGQASICDLRYSTAAITDDASFNAATPAAGIPVPGAVGSAETFVLAGLSPSTTYYAAVKIGDEVPNFSAVSNVVTFTTSAVDVTPPPAIEDLHVVPDIHAAYLSWTVPVDIGTAGLDGYDIRYSTSPIDEGSWDAAIQCPGEPVPGAAGAQDRYTVTGLDSSTTYYFAIKSFDSAEPANISALSNVAAGETRPPVVPVVVHNPWLVNDRVADTHNVDTMAACYVNAYTPDGVVLPMTDEEKAINIYNNQKRRLYHWADEPPSLGGNDINDPTYNQNVFGWALCGRHASQACTIAAAAGFGQRKTIVPGDWQYELNYDGRWHLFHTMMTFYVFTRDNPPHVASSDEIAADNTICTQAAAEGRACPGFLLCGDTAAWEADACNNYSPQGSGQVTTRWSGDMDLRIGQTFDRTCQSWANEHPPAKTFGDPPFHHEASRDNRDYVNYPYWEPYRLTSAESSAYRHRLYSDLPSLGQRHGHAGSRFPQCGLPGAAGSAEP